MKIKQAIKNNLFMMKKVFKYTPLFAFWCFATEVVVAVQTIMIGPIMIKFVIDSIQQQRPPREIIVFFLLIGGLSIIKALMISIGSEYIVPIGIPKLIKTLQGLLFKQAVKLDLSCYDNPKFYTDFVWAISQAEDRALDVFFNTLQIFGKVLIVIGFSGVILSFNPMIFVFILIALIIRLATNIISVKLRFACEVESKPEERERDYCSRVFYLANYAKELRLSSVHENLLSKLYTKTKNIININKKFGKKILTVNYFSEIFATNIFLSFMPYLYLSYQLIVKQSITYGILVAMVDSLWSMVGRTEDLIRIVPEIIKQSLYIEKFKTFLNYKSNISCGSDTLPKSREIVFKNVSFTYDGTDKNAVKNISLKIKPNEKIAIVGYNGAGKTTITKLLMRLYDVSRGEITVGGKNIKDFNLKEYRDSFGVVFQDYQLFAATVAENTVMDRVAEIHREKVSAALVNSGFKDKLSTLSHGIDTPVTREFEEHGVSFSGGESQKIAISRTFFKSCSCVILDEPSSALDPVSEYNLNQTMLEAAKDKTVIFISHRLSTTKMADTIYMLDDGEIVEQGNHDQLMKLGGKYAEMFNLQAEKYRS